jgi:hypothetical protein
VVIAIAAAVQASGAVAQICIYKKQSRLMLLSNLLKRSADAASRGANALKPDPSAYCLTENVGTRYKPRSLKRRVGSKMLAKVMS